MNVDKASSIRPYSLQWFVVFVATASLALGVPPANDECVDAEPLTGQGLFEFDNTEATGDCADPCTKVDQDVWYCWTSPCDGPVTFDTCETTVLFTAMEIYSGCACPPSASDLLVSEYGFMIGTAANCYYQSRRKFTASAGEEYLIRLGKASARSNSPLGGTGQFTIRCADLMERPCDSAESGCQPPDHYNAVASERGSAVAASRFTSAENSAVSKVCWWGIYYNGESDCSFDAVDAFEVRYYADDDGVPGELLAGPFVQAGGTLTVQGPVRTGEFLTDTAHEYEYTAEHDAVMLDAGDCYWVEITNSLDGVCRWHWVTTQHGHGQAAQDGGLGRPIDGFDLTDIAGEALAFCLNAPLGETPPCDVASPNDLCANAQSITDGIYSFTTLGASTDGPEVFPASSSPQEWVNCRFPLGDDHVQGDVWFDYVAACTGTLTVDVAGADFDAKVAVYAGAMCPTSMNATRCDDDIDLSRNLLEARVTLPAVQGQTYKFRVGGFKGARGTGSLTIDCAPHPINDDCATTAILPSLPASWLGSSLHTTQDCLKLDGAEAWIAFELAEASSIELDYARPTPVYSRAFPYLTTACPCISLITADHIGTGDNGNPLLSWNCLPAGTYYHPVIAEPGSEGAYQIVGTPAACFDVCENSNESCFAGHGTPGCDDPACCAAVCEFDEYCCNIQWDDRCAGDAIVLCNDFPASVCAAATGDCFEAHDSPGCGDLATCTRVCACDPTCCLFGWDSHCAFSGVPGSGCGGAADCNGNGVLDEDEIDGIDHPDCNDNELPDDCDAIGEADITLDGERDLADYTYFHNCFNGPDQRPSPTPFWCYLTCIRAFDLAGSPHPDTVDLHDFAAFQNLFGENAP